MSGIDPRELPPITIGDAKRLYGMTARAIRFYEERRLVAASRDRLNRRSYDAVARRRLGWISQLRRAGVGLDEIRHVLGSEPDEAAMAMRARQKLEERVAHLERDLAAVHVVLNELELPRRLVGMAGGRAR